jgi:hypothetical protein
LPENNNIHYCSNIIQSRLQLFKIVLCYRKTNEIAPALHALRHNPQPKQLCGSMRASDLPLPPCFVQNSHICFFILSAALVQLILKEPAF